MSWSEAGEALIAMFLYFGAIVGFILLCAGTVFALVLAAGFALKLVGF